MKTKCSYKNVKHVPIHLKRGQNILIKNVKPVQIHLKAAYCVD